MPIPNTTQTPNNDTIFNTAVGSAQDFQGPALNPELQALKDGFYVTVNIIGTAAQTTGNYRPFFIAYWPCEIVGIIESHTVKGSVDASVQLEKLVPGTAPHAGSSILTTAFDLTTTANTPIAKTGRDLVFTDARQLKRGDRIGLDDGGTLTDLQGLTITVYLKHLGRGNYK